MANLGLVTGLICLLILTFGILSRRRLMAIVASLPFIPSEKRAALLEREYDPLPKGGLTGEQWLKSRVYVLIFWGFLAITGTALVAFVVFISRDATAKAEAELTSAWITRRDGIQARLRSDQPLNSDELRGLITSLQVVLDKLANPAVATQAYAKTASETERRLNEIATGVSPLALAKAKEELIGGAPRAAALLLKEEASKHTNQAAENLLQAGRLAEEEGDVNDAYESYVRAAALEPGNIKVAIRRQRLAIAFAKYPEAKEILDGLRAKFSNEVKSISATREVEESYGALLLALGELPEAEKVLLDVRNNSASATIGERASTASQLGSVYHNWGRYDEAEILLSEALSLYISMSVKDDPNVASSLSNIGYLYTLQARYNLVESNLKKAQRILVARYGARHYRQIPPLNNLARFYIKTNELPLAQAMLTEALELGRRSFSGRHPFYARTLDLLAELRMSEEKFDIACQATSKALEMKVLILGGSSIEVAHTQVLEAQCLVRMVDQNSAINNLANAEIALASAARIVLSKLGEDSLLWANILFVRAQIFGQQGNLPEALSCAIKAHEVRTRRLGLAHPDTVATAQLVQDLSRQSTSSGGCVTS